VKRVFLDANVLFSAAYRSDAAVKRLWQLKNVTLMTSAYAAEEARRNLDRPDRLAALEELLESTQLTPEAPQRLVWAARMLPDKDAPILAAAVEAKAAVLLTGDLKHFGELMRRSDLPLQVCTVPVFFANLKRS
jgi:predicted nucleic acid-binding protein